MKSVLLAAFASVMCLAAQGQRDAVVPGPVGTAAVSGAVTTSESPPQPLRRAIVTLTGDGLPMGRSAISDDDGRFAIESVPPGRYTLSASKPTFLTRAYGARKAGQAGVPIELASGQRVAGVNVSLMKGAVIAGTIRDPELHGRPNVRLSAFRRGAGGAYQSMTQTAFSDDRGEYRIFGLEPGTYLVAASMSFALDYATESVSEVDAVFAALEHRPSQGTARTDRGALRAPSVVTNAPIFFPTALDPAAAEPIVVGAGEERSAVDIVMRPAQTVTVSGTVTSSMGALPQLNLTMSQLDMSLPMPTARPLAFRTGDRFTFTNVLPGSYVIEARTRQDGPQTQPGAVWAREQVEVRSENLEGITLALQPAMDLSGRLVFDATSRQPPRTMPGVLLSIFAADRVPGYSDFGWVAPARPVSLARVGPDGTLALLGVIPGRYDVRALGIPDGWTLRSVAVDGKDVLDEAWIVAGNTRPGPIVITLTDRPASLSGTLEVSTSQSATVYDIVVFPVDKSLWRPGARRIRVTRPAAGGSYELLDLPPGSYFVGLVNDATPDDLADPNFLQALAARSVKVTITDGERKNLSLKIGG